MEIHVSTHVVLAFRKALDELKEEAESKREMSVTPKIIRSLLKTWQNWASNRMSEQMFRDQLLRLFIIRKIIISPSRRCMSILRREDTPSIRGK